MRECGNSASQVVDGRSLTAVLRVFVLGGWPGSRFASGLEGPLAQALGFGTGTPRCSQFVSPRNQEFKNQPRKEHGSATGSLDLIYTNPKRLLKSYKLQAIRA